MLRMLIVDDEEHIVNALYGVLAERFDDIEIQRAYSSVTALKMITKMRFDLIISDISMPQMSGLELLDEIRRLWPRCYVLLLTAYDRFDYAYQAIKYERVDYLLKIESYDEICRIVQGKLTLIHQQQEEDEKLLCLGKDLNTISTSVSRYFLKRIILQGTPLPTEKDLAGIRLHMSLSSPALLVLGSLSTSSPAERSRIVAGIDEYLTERLSEVALQGFSCVSTSYAFWIFQAKESRQRPESEQYVFLQELLDDLPTMVEKRMGHHLALLCADAFVPWCKLHELYQRASINLEQWRNENGTVLFSACEEMNVHSEPSTFPNLDEVNMLWEMMKSGNTLELMTILRKGLASIARVHQMTALLPSTAVTGVAFLLSQAANLYAPDMMHTSEFRRLIACIGYDAGDEWVSDVMKTMEDILESREGSKKNMNDWLIERIHQYIEQHYSEDVTLAALADEVHYSPSYLSRFYKAQTGTNIMTTINNVRINHAKTLLTTTSLKLSDIAVQCGFCSTKYFNQVFRRITNVSAMQYRK